MSDKLLIRARFIAGQFNATGERGAPEWPPSPDRLLGAMLATAPESTAVREAYTLTAPTIITPVCGERSSDYARWVPIQVGLTRGVPEAPVKNLRNPEVGTLISPDSEVVWVFDDGAHLADALGEIATQVTYLGRPTSPVILTVAVGDEPAAPEGGDVWRPSEHGTVRVSVPTAQRLKNLDAAYEASLQATRGTSPALMVGGRAARTFTPYTRHTQHPVAAYTPATDAKATAFLTGRTVIGISGAPVGPGSVQCLITALIEAGATEVYPVIAPDPHLGQDRLLGAIASGPVTDTTMFAYDHVAQLRHRRVPSTPFLIAAKRAASASELWTTSAPVPNDATTLRESLAALAAEHGVDIVAAAAHPEDAVTGWQNCDDRLDITHVSVRFTSPVPGPLALSGVTLLPRRDHA